MRREPAMPHGRGPICKSSKTNRLSPVRNKLVHCHPDILRDLSQQRRRDVSSLMKRNRRTPAVIPSILDVRTTLTNRDKTQPLQNPADLPGLQYRNRSHGQETTTFCVPTNSASNSGSPSSRSMAITSLRLPLSSSWDSAWECAPGNPGTYPTSKPVTGSRSTTAVKVRTPLSSCLEAKGQVHRLPDFLKHTHDLRPTTFSNPQIYGSVKHLK